MTPCRTSDQGQLIVWRRTFALDDLADLLHSDDSAGAAGQLLHHVAELRVGLHDALKLRHVRRLRGISPDGSCRSQLARHDPELWPGKESSGKHFDVEMSMMKNDG